MIPILQFNELSPEDILNRDIRQETGVDEAVDAVLAAVRERGDDALRDYTASTALNYRSCKYRRQSWMRRGIRWMRSSSER